MTLRARALNSIHRNKEGKRIFGRRFTAAMERSLLLWASFVPDDEILTWHQTGPAMLRWIREHEVQAVPNEFQAPANDLQAALLPAGQLGMIGKVLQLRGWRVELFWNSGGDWFTARLISPVDRAGQRRYEGGYLVPFDDPLDASGATPAEAIAALEEAVLEWA